MTDILTIAQDTWFTLSKSQSIDLPDEQKRLVSAGERLPLLSHEPDADWMRAPLDGDRLSSNPFGNDLTWYVKAADVEFAKDLPFPPALVSKIMSRILVAVKRGDTNSQILAGEMIDTGNPPDNPS